MTTFGISPNIFKKFSINIKSMNQEFFQAYTVFNYASTQGFLKGSNKFFDFESAGETGGSSNFLTSSMHSIYERQKSKLAEREIKKRIEIYDSFSNWKNLTLNIPDSIVGTSNFFQSYKTIKSSPTNSKKNQRKSKYALNQDNKELDFDETSCICVKVDCKIQDLVVGNK